MAQQTSPSEEHEERLAILISDLADRAQAGGRVDLEEQCRLHPEFAGELRELWGAVVVAQAAGSVSITSTAPVMPRDSDLSGGAASASCTVW